LTWKKRNGADNTGRAFDVIHAGMITKHDFI
jgi:hypothetical protein